MDLISKATRLAFREHLVGWTLATISDLFDAEDIARGEVPQERLPSGQRRSLVEEYYASVNWSNGADARKILRAFEQVLLKLEEPSYLLTDDAREREQRKLLNFLKRDGFDYASGRISGNQNPDLAKVERAAGLVDRLVLRDHLDRIELSIDSDPAQAVGSAKELLETIAKQILESYSEPHDCYDSIQQLCKAAMRSLDLSVEAIPDASKGASALKQMLAGLNQIVGGAAEIRNLYGTGHGRTRRGGLKARHARLVVGAVSTLCLFFLETLDERKRAAATAPIEVI